MMGSALLEKPLSIEKDQNVYEIFDLLGKKWMVFILYLLCHRVSTFNAILKQLPKMNAKTLSERLDLLIEGGYIVRHVTQDKPLKINYTLSPLGQELGDRIRDVATWIQDKNV